MIDNVVDISTDDEVTVSHTNHSVGEDAEGEEDKEYSPFSNEVQFNEKEEAEDLKLQRMLLKMKSLRIPSQTKIYCQMQPFLTGIMISCIMMLLTVNLMVMVYQKRPEEECLLGQV
ncbi:hypothetical protein ACOSQ3_002210 [Xanthoceras sorbifolium]